MMSAPQPAAPQPTAAVPADVAGKVADAAAKKPAPYILSLNPATTATPAPRLEIREFFKDPHTATLFLRALISIQDRPASRLDSFTRIASIHGSPTAFDGVNPFPKEPFGGYCQHNTQLFTPWHRPYLLMLEQVLWAEANRMAAEYKVEKDKYVAAAKRIRLPFWDWGLKSADVPLILTRWSVEVTMPDGSKKKVRNPLSNYAIPADALKAFQITDPDLRVITRNPRRNPANNSLVTSVPDLQRSVKEAVPELRGRLVAMFKTGNYECFSNRDFKPASLKCTTEENVESVHDTVHVIVGSDSGQMSLVELAAFDPIFWLHHCNVDRHLALWEGIYPKGAIKEGAPGSAGIGTSSRDITIRSTDAMYPFRKTDKTWWTPRDLMNVYDATKAGTRRLGYYYPELQDPKVTPAQLLAKIDALYNDNKGARRTAMALPAIDTRRVKGPFRLEVDLQPVAPASSRSDRALPLPKVRAGMVGVFKRVDPSSCDNCSMLEGKVRANLDITDALAQIRSTTPPGTTVKVTVTAVPLHPGAAAKGVPIAIGTPIIYSTIDGEILPATGAPATATATPAARALPAAAAAAAAAGAAPAPAAAADDIDDTLPVFEGLENLQGVVAEKPPHKVFDAAEAAELPAQ